MASGVVFGCIVPHPPILVPAVGGSESRRVEATARALESLAEEIRALEPEVLLLISPHGPARMEAMGVIATSEYQGDLADFRAPNVRLNFRNDSKLIAAIQRACSREGIPLVTMDSGRYHPDHGVVVPMYFLRRALPETLPMVPLTFSWLPYTVHCAFGRALQAAGLEDGRRIVFVASGDLSHRLLPGAPAGYDPVGKEFDRQVVEAVASWDVQKLTSFDDKFIERAGECGYRSILVLIGVLGDMKVKPRVLSYEGPFGVGYLVARCAVAEESAL